MTTPDDFRATADLMATHAPWSAVALALALTEAARDTLTPDDPSQVRAVASLAVAQQALSAALDDAR